MEVAVSGFTIIRNGMAFDYPFLESIRSVLPVVDEFVVNVGVGPGTDHTLEAIRELTAEVNREMGYEKIRWLESVWPMDDPEKKKSGLILSEQTNLALDQCRGKWAVYIQSDEVLHEDDYSRLSDTLKNHLHNDGVDGLVFDYHHFYGSYQVEEYSRAKYRREVRVVKTGRGVRSIGDAQSFRMSDGQKLRVLHSGARIFHYGWVRTPEAMQSKTYFMDQLYHGDPEARNAKTQTPHSGDNYRYRRYWGLKKFRGSHPQVMQRRIAEKDWNWDLERSPMIWNFSDIKKVTLDLLERVTGHRFFEYRSYRLLKRDARHG